MFGYVKPMVSELKVKEHELYKSIYCGLCHAMGENICQSQRFTLSYDILFLVLVRIALTNETIHIEKKNCIVHPIKKRNHAFVPKTLKYCSEIAAILTYYKLLDDLNDTKSISKARYKMLLPWAKKLVKRADSPEIQKKCAENIEQLSSFENSNSSLDCNADCFGSLLGHIFAFDINEKDKYEAAFKIGYHCGKWIYIIDACDDFEDDKEKGEYNPLSNFDSLPKETLSISATLELSKAKEALDSINIENKQIYSIINNILTLGMPEVQEKIIKE